MREDHTRREDLPFISGEGAFDLPQLTWLRGYRCRYRQTLYSDDLFQRQGVPLPPHLCSAVQDRKGEFLAGRYAAQKALQRWGMEPGPVHIGRHRSPVWPVGWVGSITHEGETAISATACSADCHSLGVDLAAWFSTKEAERLSVYIVQPEEVQMLAACGLPRAWALTLAFSAKESLFKALYPLVGAYFDFHALELLTLDMGRRQFQARARASLCPFLCPILEIGTRIQGALQLGAGTVFTAAWLPGEMTR